MDIREIVPGFAVSPQVAPSDMVAACRRRLPHGDLQPPRCTRSRTSISPTAIRQAAEEAGLRFVLEPDRDPRLGRKRGDAATRGR